MKKCNVFQDSAVLNNVINVITVFCCTVLYSEVKTEDFISLHCTTFTKLY